MSLAAGTTQALLKVVKMVCDALVEWRMSASGGMELEINRTLDHFLSSVDEALDIVQDAMMRFACHYAARAEADWGPPFSASWRLWPSAGRVCRKSASRSGSVTSVFSSCRRLSTRPCVNAGRR